jgi:hypothetical protein
MKTKRAAKASASLPDRRLRVGVTLHLRQGPQSIWENGVFQNCAFLVQLLAASPAVAEAVLVIDREEPTVPTQDMMLDGLGLQIISMPQALQTLDVVIEMSAQFPEEWVQTFRARGGRYAWMRVGNDYVIDIERAMFDKPNAGLCSPKIYDAVWTLPEYERSCTDYFALTARAPVRIVPHLWTPLFIDKAIAAMPSQPPFGYQPGRARWRVCCFEPNLCMVKTGVIPLLACEEAYRAQPGFLESMRVCNSLRLKTHSVYVEFARTLDVVQHGLATFEGRFHVYEYMAQHGDCIVSHHWENGQNYLHYEALYGGYPLVHNSEFIRDYGYYYPDFDCEAGGQALLRAFREHDQQLDSYKEHSQKLLRELDVRNPQNVETYTRELLALYEPR